MSPWDRAVHTLTGWAVVVVFLITVMTPVPWWTGLIAALAVLYMGGHYTTPKEGNDK